MHTLIAEWGLWRVRKAEAKAASDVQELSIEAVPELPPPVPPPEPEPKVEPQVVAVAPPEPETAPETEEEQEEEQEEEPPSSEAAQAGEVLTQEDDEEDEDDDEEEVTFVTGHAESYAGGLTAASGTSTLAVRGAIDPSGGVPGGTGTHAIAAPKPPNDKSRQAWLLGSNWDCDFPGEADRDDINHAAVEIAVVVRPNGTPQDVKVLEDPGHGFARTACACALKHKFLPARDKDGNSIWGTTPPFHVGFHR